MKSRDGNWVYVAGPYSNGDPVVNVREACAAGDILYAHGFIPIVPHMSMLWHMFSPKPYDHWLEYDLYLLHRCDALVRLPGLSAGADREVEYARARGIPVFTSLAKVLELAESNLSNLGEQSNTREKAEEAGD